jgi:UDP-N-acetylmuramate dehydrogenase
MSELEDAVAGLQSISHLSVRRNEPIAPYTRFAIGGPAALLCESADEDAFSAALALCHELRVPTTVIGGGSNLVVADEGYRGVVLRFTGAEIEVDDNVLRAQAGGSLQAAVDRSIAAGLSGIHTMTGVPGSVGGAVYGNAGAYGHSMEEVVRSVHFTDGRAQRTFTNAQCEFRYRDSIFKRHKGWIVLSAELHLIPAPAADLRRVADEIRAVRDAKYPPDMRCAGSIFKNLFVTDLPANVQAQVPANLIRDGKVPSAWFLEQAGVKGLRRGDIQVADYHANLIYNDGHGTARDLVTVIEEVKDRVRAKFGFAPEEEVQYVGF